MTTMTLGTVSVCMTVLVLNIHHRGADTRMSPWLRRLALVRLARCVGVRTSALDAALDRQGRPLTDGCPQSSPPLPHTTTASGVLRRRQATRQEHRQCGDSRRRVGNDDGRTLSCHYMPLDGVANDVSFADFTCNNVGPPPPPPKSFPDTPLPPSNGPSSLGLRVPSVVMSCGRRWRSMQRQQQRQQQTRWLFDATGSIVGGRLSCSGGDCFSTSGRSPPPLPQPQLRVVTVDDDDDDDDEDNVDETNLGENRDDRGPAANDSGDAAVSEWTELARVLDRTFFWLLFALMTMSAVIILMYPKYTGNEEGWALGG